MKRSDYLLNISKKFDKFIVSNPQIEKIYLYDDEYIKLYKHIESIPQFLRQSFKIDVEDLYYKSRLIKPYNN